ncbi:Uncharacterised protein [Yersinia enterocolitica]|nr:Uncharacterised protein [Yersinia enterocolitica]CQH15922.1 Uncharacterised protein [Yersinia enterocolitica]CQH33445.1 Uncharacterised protein [Yersinia enterocolitica]CQH40698.1 Uncharacterised protein [Yersinia enterocolitica]CQH40882.1 Uncharacterised protein [Yersinia enterocolitica]
MKEMGPYSKQYTLNNIYYFVTTMDAKVLMSSASTYLSLLADAHTYPLVATEHCQNKSDTVFVLSAL